MKREVIIDNYGIGHAAVVLENGKIIDCFIDPPKGVQFYPPNTFVRAHIERKIDSMGGYFVKLPNGNQGYLKSKNKYEEGKSVVLLSKVISESHKSQAFTDILKSVSKYFVIKIATSGIYFSKKIPQNFDVFKACELLHSKLKNYDDIFVICRSSIADISADEFNKEFEKMINHIQKIKANLDIDRLYFDGLARQIVFEMYRDKFYNVKEQEGVFERLGIWDQLEEIKNGRIRLETGSYLIFEQTSALLTIDVNSGTDFKGTKEQINLSACIEIYRIIRVCGFGGKIVIDFLPCAQNVRKRIYKEISNFFFKDSAKIKIWGWTKSGIFELERTRDKIPLKLLM